MFAESGPQALDGALTSACFEFDQVGGSNFRWEAEVFSILPMIRGAMHRLEIPSLSKR